MFRGPHDALLFHGDVGGADVVLELVLSGVSFEESIEIGIAALESGAIVIGAKLPDADRHGYFPKSSRIAFVGRRGFSTRSRMACPLSLETTRRAGMMTSTGSSRSA